MALELVEGVRTGGERDRVPQHPGRLTPGRPGQDRSEECDRPAVRPQDMQNRGTGGRAQWVRPGAVAGPHLVVVEAAVGSVAVRVWKAGPAQRVGVQVTVDRRALDVDE